MEMSHFKQEHVAQQSRRHKLRFQQSSTQAHPFEDISSNLEHVQFQPGLDTQVYNNSSSISSQMLNFSNRNGSKNVVPHLNSSSFNIDSTSSERNVEKSGVWRSVGSNQSCDQMINFGCGLATRSGRNDNAMVVDLQGSSDDLGKFMNNRHQEMNLDSSQLGYQSSYRDHVVTTAFVGQQAGNYIRDNVSNSNWSSQCGNELALLPTYREDSNVLNQNTAASWISRVVEEGNHWNSGLGFLPNKTECGLRTAGNESSPQGLVLSLCSNPSSALHGSRFGERSIPEALLSRAFEVSEELKPPRPLKPVSKSSGGSLQDVVVGTTSSSCNRQMGPLGPFTGYATILKSSRFLRPAQQLLDEFCGIVGSKLVKVSDSWEKNPGEPCALADAVVKFADSEVQSKSSTSDVALPTSQRSDHQLGKLIGTVESSSCDSHSPEHQHRKAKLLYMQEEVSRRYKQYHQQMQMVVASFESVAGLTGATPYISLALRTVSKHFRHLKNGISEQLRNIRTIGEDLSSQTAGTSNAKTHGSGSRIKMVDEKFSDSGFNAPPQHIWRPQRGLPERAVSVLRAWLFEHFLHPYPTDTDKHMLATQTGLTRNQVSNWFINARVRLWKPMVEEIHMLETNGVTERDVHVVKEGKNSISTMQGTSQLNSDNSSSEPGTSDKTIKQFESSTVAPSLDTEQYKRSRVDGQVTPIMDGGMMDFMPYYRSGLEMAGHGSVSLTLGLRQSADHRHVVEGARYHHEQLQQEDHIRRHFGSHFHEFVG